MLNNLLPEYSIERGKTNIVLENPHKHYVSQVIMVSINCDKSQVDSMHP